jgi:hypothetical protein
VPLIEQKKMHEKERKEKEEAKKAILDLMGGRLRKNADEVEEIKRNMLEISPHQSAQLAP